MFIYLFFVAKMLKL